jgi:hypothetical protein
MPSTILNYNPMHTELALAIFVGDHDPAHAQGPVFRSGFHLPRRGIFVVDCALKLRRRHRYWYCE